jgi:hypothetical protein
LAKLIIYEELGNTQTIFETFDLSNSRMTIGSDMDNQLVLDSPDIDPMHASLELREHDEWYLQDLGGPGGTAIGDQLIEGPRLLKHGDIIALGPVKMRFLLHDQPRQADNWPPPIDEEMEDPDTDPATGVMKGRVWFAGQAILTSAIIFGIVLFFVAAHLLGFINLADLWPFG